MGKQTKLEEIKLQLEEKLMEIDKNKLLAKKKEEELSKKRESEKAKILEEEVNTDAIKAKIAAVSKKELKLQLEKKLLEIEQKKEREAENQTLTNKKDKVKKEAVTPAKSKIGKKKKEIETKEKKSLSKKITPKKEDVKQKSTKNQPKPVIFSNKVILALVIVSSLWVLIFIYKLRLDLNKEKEALELKKKELIDYNKQDVIFKDVEEEAKEEELQDIE